MKRNWNSRQKARKAILAFSFLATVGGAANGSRGQSGATVDSPFFRPRTDSMATQDADAVRERLKALSDSRGPINPLADYVKTKEPAKTPLANSDRNIVDEEARRIPSLDSEAQQRLKAKPPSVAAEERYVIGLYPPPQITTRSGEVVASSWQDDGFRPVVVSSSVGFPPYGAVVRSSYQIGDPAAMIPPSLGTPSGNLPTYSAPPSSGLPPISAPATPPPIGAPATIVPPGASLGGLPSGVPMMGAPGSNIMPAPPSYIVPGPAGTYAPPANAAPYAAPYAAPSPTYSRSGGTVNSLPFVSPPPQPRDARWMVSPDVYRRMDGGVCAAPTAPGYAAPPTNTSNGSPFFYAPPTAMPMSTPRTASRHSWLHPFRP